MIQRIVTAAVLSAGVAVSFSPSFAQTVIGSAIIALPSQAPQGGTVTISQGSAGVSSSQSGMMATTAAPSGIPTSGPPMARNAQAKPRSTDNQAQAARRAAPAADVNAAELQLTECLNDAAAQGQSLDSCKQ